MKWERVRYGLDAIAACAWLRNSEIVAAGRWEMAVIQTKVIKSMNDKIISRIRGSNGTQLVQDSER